MYRKFILNKKRKFWHFVLSNLLSASYEGLIIMKIKRKKPYFYIKILPNFNKIERIYVKQNYVVFFYTYNKVLKSCSIWQKLVYCNAEAHTVWHLGRLDFVWQRFMAARASLPPRVHLNILFLISLSRGKTS